MSTDQFEARFAQVRARFAARLGSRIDDIAAALPQLCGGREVMELLSETHRRAHDLCGIGPTVGFTATGQAARGVERVLLVPLKAERGLTPDEVEALRGGIQRLRQVAQDEVKAFAGAPAPAAQE